MSNRYRYGYKPAKHRTRKLFILVGIVLAVVLIAVGYVVYDIAKNSQQQTVEGPSRVIQQGNNGSAQKVRIEEPTFSIELPSDWKFVRRRSDKNENSVTWEEAKKKTQNDRFMTVYVDTIPPNMAINRLLPVAAQEEKLVANTMSDNCATFTEGGTLNTQKAQLLSPKPAKWQRIDFICDLPNVIDNKVGIGSLDGINVVAVKGPTKGTHKYFFVYNEHSIQPNYNILTNAITSFRAK